MTKTVDEEMLFGVPVEEKATTEADVCSRMPTCAAWWDGKCHAVGGDYCQQSPELSQ